MEDNAKAITKIIQILKEDMQKHELKRNIKHVTTLRNIPSEISGKLTN